MQRTNDNVAVVADDREINTTLLCPNEYEHEQEQNRSTSRDTSDTSRHFELNNTRDSTSSRQNITVNTHDSILDLESQCTETSFCDEDENMLLGIADEFPSDGNSIVFDDFPHNILSGEEKTEARSVSPSSSTTNEGKHSRSNVNVDTLDVDVDVDGNNPDNTPDNCTKKEHKKTTSIMNGLTLYSVTDSFVDSLCTSTACVVSENYNIYTKTTNNNNNKSALSSMDDKISQFQQSCYYWKQPEQSSTSSSSSTSKAVVSMDIWQLLGCSSPPGESELEEIWSLRTTSEMLRNGQQPSNNKESKRQPVRASIKKRLKRIHRLRMDDRRVSGASRHGVTITNHCINNHPISHNHSLNNIRKDIHMNKNKNNNSSNSTDSSSKHHQLNQPQQNTQPSYRAIDRSYSMLDDPLADFFGQGMIEPIPVKVEEEEDGYDSDPEVNYYSASSSMIITDSPTRSQSERMDSLRSSSSSSFISPQQYHTSNTDTNNTGALLSSNELHEVLRARDPIPTDETEMRESVQETLNSTWTLTWHPNEGNRKEYNISHNKPICINMWLERGTVITNSGVVVEPAFMWRDAYQPLLLSQHKLNNSTQKPWSMRLLNACRITSYFNNNNNNIDRTKYPLARQNASFLMKSCTGEEFLLEAKGPHEAIAITERWKLVVARFACLAVTEDVGGIATEFFHPTSDSKMDPFPVEHHPNDHY